MGRLRFDERLPGAAWASASTQHHDDGWDGAAVVESSQGLCASVCCLLLLANRDPPTLRTVERTPQLWRSRRAVRCSAAAFPTAAAEKRLRQGCWLLPTRWKSQRPRYVHICSPESRRPSEALVALLRIAHRRRAPRLCATRGFRCCPELHSPLACPLLSPRAAAVVNGQGGKFGRRPCWAARGGELIRFISFLHAR